MELFKNIFFNTDKIIGNTDIKLTYAGKLFQDGVQSVLVHYGYGENWDYAGDIQMEKTELGYQANIYVQQCDTLNFCFKGINGEWDNNNGQNYTFKIENEEVAEPVQNTVYNYANTEYTENSANVENDYVYKNAVDTINNAYDSAVNTTNNVYGNTAETIYENTTATANGTWDNTTVATGNVYENAENTQVEENKSLITTTPTWTDLIKKTFHNIVNYFSKLFSGKKANVNDTNE